MLQILHLSHSRKNNNTHSNSLQKTNLQSFPSWARRNKSRLREDPAIQQQNPTVQRVLPRRGSWSEGRALFRKTEGLGMLNLIAALYGCSTVINKFVEDDVPNTPNSLTSLIRFLSAGKRVLRSDVCTDVGPTNQCGTCFRGPTACVSVLERSSMMDLSPIFSLATFL